MFSEKNKKELEELGVTVVTNVLTEEECASCIEEYQSWLSEFEEGDWPMTMHSLIQMYGIGHFNASWKARLKARNVFSEIWGTNKLLTSIDAVAIGRPPECGSERFADPDENDHWLHTDQDSDRRGLHAYQGAVYLEDAEIDDWTFHVMERSHLYIDELYDSSMRAAIKSSTNKVYYPKDDEIEKLKSQGCDVKRIPVPKGGMVLWDSRLIHANARPIKGREHSERWRYCVMVCMAPAVWSTADDMKTKKQAYQMEAMTSHWPCTDVRIMSSKEDLNSPSDKFHLKTLPDIATRKEVKQLCGAVPYNFNDGEPNGPEWKPEWRDYHSKRTHNSEGHRRKYYLLSVAGIVFAVMLSMGLKKCFW